MLYGRIRIWTALVALAVSGVMPAMAAETVFARVNGNVISTEVYDAALGRAFRAKFYHGKPPAEQLAQLQRDVGDDLIDRVLLLAEAARRGIVPDAEKIAAALAEFEARNRDNPRWRQDRNEFLPVVTKGLEQQNVLERLERAVRGDGSPPSPEEVRDYFEANRKTFTEPERLRLSVILLKVDPGAPQADRDAADEEAKRIRQRLADGADFAELARARSGDFTAPNGGNMGYVHRGMLPEPLQAKIDQMAPGVLSEPILLLEGTAIFRLEERLPERPMSFEQSKENAARLCQAEREQRRWTDLKAALRKASLIEIVDPLRYPAVPAIDK